MEVFGSRLAPLAETLSYQEKLPAEKKMAKYIHAKMVSDQEKLFNQQFSHQQISNQREQYQEQIFHQFKDHTYTWKQTTRVLRSLFATWRHVLSNGQIPNKIMENGSKTNTKYQLSSQKFIVSVTLLQFFLAPQVL